MYTVLSWLSLVKICIKIIFTVIGQYLHVQLQWEVLRGGGGGGGLRFIIFLAL